MPFGMGLAGDSPGLGRAGWSQRRRLWRDTRDSVLGWRFVLPSPLLPLRSLRLLCWRLRLLRCWRGHPSWRLLGPPPPGFWRCLRGRGVGVRTRAPPPHLARMAATPPCFRRCMRWAALSGRTFGTVSKALAILAAGHVRTGVDTTRFAETSERLSCRGMSSVPPTTVRVPNPRHGMSEPWPSYQ